MSMTDSRTSSLGTPTPPSGPSRRGFVITAIVAVVTFIAVLVGAIALSHHGKPARTTTQETTPTTKDTVPSTSVTTTTGSTGNPTEIPAAQTNPPSLAGAYSSDPI